MKKSYGKQHLYGLYFICLTGCLLNGCGSKREIVQEDANKAIALFIAIDRYVWEHTENTGELGISSPIILDNNSARVEFTIKYRNLRNGNTESEKSVAVFNQTPDKKWLFTKVLGVTWGGGWQTEPGDLNWPLDRLKAIEEYSRLYKFFQYLTATKETRDVMVEAQADAVMASENGFGLFGDSVSRQMFYSLTNSPAVLRNKHIADDAQVVTSMSSKGKIFFQRLKTDAEEGEIKKAIKEGDWEFSEAEIRNLSSSRLLTVIFMEESMQKKAKETEIYKDLKAIFLGVDPKSIPIPDNINSSKSIYEYINSRLQEKR